VRAVLVIAALLGARAAVLLVTAGDDERSSAAAQLPATDMTSPPAGHHADPDLKTYGPRGFATATVRNMIERYRFTAPGEYKLYCSIHPVLMSQVVKVR
jgi:plastocyanin